MQLEAGIHTRRRKPFLSFDFVQGGRAVLENATKSRVIAKDGINPFASATAYHFDKFISALHNGSVPSGTVKDNRNTLALVFAAYDSAESGAAVKLSRYLATNGRA